MNKSELIKFAFDKLNGNEYQLAINAFKKSLDLKEDWQSYQGLGAALLKFNDNLQSINPYKQSLALKENWQSYQGLGLSLLKTWQYQQAIDAFRQSLALKENWQSYQGLGSALFKINIYIDAIKAFRKSLALKEDWQSYQMLGSALLKVKQYQLAADSFKKSIALKEDWNSYQGLGLALFEQGKVDRGLELMRKYYKNVSPYYDINPFLGVRKKVTITRDQIEFINNQISKFKFAFYPSFPFELEENNQSQDWKNLIHIHIPKCAGSNFVKPLMWMPRRLREASNMSINNSYSKNKLYLWQGILDTKCNHDAFVLESLHSEKIKNIQGSFFSNHGSKHGVYSRKFLDAGIQVKKICLVRDSSERLYSHVKHNGRVSYSKDSLLNQCMRECLNVMDRYIYDYDLMEGQKELPYCSPTDYEQCDSIDFIDISDHFLTSMVKSSFLSASSMPNIVQYDRLNDDVDKSVIRDSLVEKDFRDVHRELILRGYLDRDSLIDLEYLKDRTKQRLVFPDVVSKGVELHPVTYIYCKSGQSKFVSTKSFIADPLSVICF